MKSEKLLRFANRVLGRAHMPKMLVVDFDGTLAGAPDEDQHVRDWLREESIPFVIATGRSLRSVTAALRERDLPEPEVVISLDIMIAGSSAQARELLLPEAWAMAESRATGAFPPLRPDPPERLTPKQQSVVEQQLQLAVHGTADDVLQQLRTLVERTGAAEVLASTSTYDLDALAEADAALAALGGLAT